MSTFARLTLIGLYNHVPELFDKLTLPNAYDRDTFIDTVLLEQGEKCVAYPEPDFFRYAVGVWSRKWAKSLERIALALTEEYNPLHNYDRHEKWEEHEEGDYKNNVTNSGDDVTTRTGDIKTANTGTTTTENSGNVITTENGTTSEETQDMTTERTVSSFNESSYQPDEKSVTNGTVIRTPDTTQTVTPNTTETVTPDTLETVTPNTTDTLTHGAVEDGSGNDRRDREHNAHLYGNIGVTTSQQMVEAEIDLRRNQNMYTIAAELFADDLLLMLY